MAQRRCCDAAPPPCVELVHDICAAGKHNFLRACSAQPAPCKVEIATECTGLPNHKDQHIFMIECCRLDQPAPACTTCQLMVRNEERIAKAKAKMQTYASSCSASGQTLRVQVHMAAPPPRRRVWRARVAASAHIRRLRGGCRGSF